MAQTIVVGDSVGLGISKALSGSMFAGAEGLRIDQMQNHFNSAVATAEKGDIVIISAGYNSTGPNGISADDLKSLQTLTDQLNAKGAKVVIAPLRESGMTGDYAKLNGQTAKTNEQLRTLKGATVAEGCIASANGIAGGEIHGAYTDLGRMCYEAGSKAVAPSGAGVRSEADREADSAGSKGESSGLEGIWETIKGFFSMIAEAISGIFSKLFGSDESKEPATPAATPPAKPSQEAKAAPDAQAQAAALAAAKDNPAAGTGAEASTVAAPVVLPEAVGPRITVR